MSVNVLASLDIMDTVYITTSNYGHSVEVVSGLELSALYFGQRLNSAASARLNKNHKLVQNFRQRGSASMDVLSGVLESISSIQVKKEFRKHFRKLVLKCTHISKPIQ